ncbi:MAG: hypothetical protein IJN20_04920 [Oscillospiraceae bacterium]|nr:hypothetical protein [Oscillospiraceae bacterium]
MNLESTIETIASHLPEEIQIPGLLTDAVSRIPADIDFSTVAKFLLFYVAGSLILSCLGRVVLGKHSSLNHSLSSAMGILFIYAVTIVIYTFKPWKLEALLSPLPFVTFFNDYMVVMPVIGIRPTVLSRELLSLIFLAFLVNLSDTLLPKGKSVLGWFFWRIITIILSMGLHLLMHWAFTTFAPNFLVTYAPIVLLLLLVFLMFLGFLNAILGLVLTITNPLIGAAYTFFFSNIVGKQFTKAVFTAGILSIIVYLMGAFGYNFVNISTTSLTAYVPIAVISLILWYFIGYLL